jgi:hypothetical protein
VQNIHVSIDDIMSSVVQDWFGSGFSELHPLLQQLHQSGGSLSGAVEVTFGKSLAGIIGRRIAKVLGVPQQAGQHTLNVAIHSQEGALHWSRQFDSGRAFVSHFIPYGHYPDGYWIERSGLLKLHLKVQVRAGGPGIGCMCAPTSACFVFPSVCFQRRSRSNRSMKVSTCSRSACGCRFSVKRWLTAAG